MSDVNLYKDFDWEFYSKNRYFDLLREDENNIAQEDADLLMEKRGMTYVDAARELRKQDYHKWVGLREYAAMLVEQDPQKALEMERDFRERFIQRKQFQTEPVFTSLFKTIFGAAFCALMLFSLISGTIAYIIFDYQAEQVQKRIERPWSY